MDPTFLKKIYELEDIEEFEDIIDNQLKLGNKKNVEEIAGQLKSANERKCLFLDEKLEVLKVKMEHGK